MIRCLLLGPNGQLGSDIRAAGTQRDYPIEIIPLDRIAVDLSQIDAASRLIGGLAFDCLINCASYHKTDEVEGNAQLAFTINAHLVQRLAELCAEKKARFVHVSTDYVFGGQTKKMPLDEQDARAALNVYGASKAMGESLALAGGGDVIVARVASLFGVAGASGKGGNFVETMIRMSATRKQVSVVADQWMSPTATADVAAALLDIVSQDAPGGIWHIVNSGAATWHDFAARIFDRLAIAAEAVPIPTTAFPTPAKRPPYSVLDNSKLAKFRRPMRHWHEALDDYLVRKGHVLQ